MATTSYVDHLVSQLHGRDDIQHIGGLSHLLLIKNIKMVEACAADQDMDSLLLQFFEVRKGFRCSNGQFYAVIDKDKTP